MSLHQHCVLVEFHSESEACMYEQVTMFSKNDDAMILTADSEYAQKVEG